MENEERPSSGPASPTTNVLRARSGPLKFDLWDLACGLVAEFEEFRLGEPEAVGDEAVRERLDRGVQIADCAIVIAPRHLQLVFDGGELVLEIAEIGVGLEFGIGLGD